MTSPSWDVPDELPRQTLGRLRPGGSRPPLPAPTAADSRFLCARAGPARVALRVDGDDGDDAADDE